MSRVLEAIMSAMLGIFTFFVNLPVSRYDDPVLAEYKRRKIACVASTGVFILITGVTFLAGEMLDSIQQRSILTMVADGLRTPLAYFLLAAMTASFAYMVYAYYALLRFTHDGGSFPE
jgi:hypothetical protein